MPGIIDRYRDYLGIPNIPAITLGEGHTPLISWATWEQSDIFLKLEGTNPTGSFKDRGMTVAVSVALSEGAQAVICASTGNTAASAAAYAGRAGLPAFVVAPKGRITQEKMLQALVHGATFLTVEGNFDAALAVVRATAQANPAIALVNSVNPWRLRGQETGAYEIVDELGQAPQALVLPVGNAGNISAYFQGFRRYGRGIPHMFGIQAQGASPLVAGYDFENPETIASAIRIGKPASKHLAQEAVAQSNGAFLAVSDEAILQAQRELARGGVFVEPASATAYAGLKVLREQKRLPAGPVAAILTGTGLKDGDTPRRWVDVKTQSTDADHLEGTIRALLKEGTVHVAH
ncbi:MAG: threonine synthase [Sulfobacillus acidophilus]|uniref:Threonine synthase n=1 Tax=Sulfobacillus acidophilus TaxID=53633 RepID=A0A2T2WLZ1_9FIRM|nr:MAG: threonine synthase [Sulfobacillus acidophilus]